MTNIVQVNGVKGAHLFDIWTNGTTRAVASDEENGRIDLMVGGEQMSIFVNRHWLLDEQSQYPATVKQFNKLEETE